MYLGLGYDEKGKPFVSAHFTGRVEGFDLEPENGMLLARVHVFPDSLPALAQAAALADKVSVLPGARDTSAFLLLFGKIRVTLPYGTPVPAAGTRVHVTGFFSQNDQSCSRLFHATEIEPVNSNS